MSVFARNFYQPFATAAVSFHDRGHNLGDGVYEYILAWHGRLIDLDLHLTRLYRSLAKIDINNAISAPALRLKIIDFCRQNRLQNGGVYIQLTRGTAARDHYYDAALKPNLGMFIKHYTIDGDKPTQAGVAVRSHPDIRWHHRDVKVISLVASAITKQWAKNNGGAEVVFYTDADIITEGGASNMWLVDRAGVLRTHLANHAILNGITKLMVERVAKESGMRFEPRAFTRAECYEGQEMFFTSTSNPATPIIMMDDKVIGNGQPGPLTKKIKAALLAEMEKQPILL